MACGQTVDGKVWHMATPVLEWCCCDQRTAAAHTLAPATVGSVQIVQRIRETALNMSRTRDIYLSTMC